MKNIYNNNLVKFASLGLITVMGLAACSDDHFDVQSFGSETTTQTIMDNLKSSEELGDFVTILSRVRVKRSETDKNSASTYADLLNSPQTYTVWAPVDDSYDPQVYIDMLDEADRLRANDRVEEAVALEYKVENQFVKNHIARFNYENVSGLQQIRMLNSKVYPYDATENMFNGVSQVQNADMISNNGAIHILNSPAKYFHNIFDYLGYDEDFNAIYTLIMKEDKTEFDEGASVPGTLNQNGQMVYVDSVYKNENVFLNNSGAQIKNEDSLYIAVIPTDEGLESARTLMRSYFNYGATYNNSWSNSEGEFSNTGDMAFKTSERWQDSLADQSILTNMYFSATDLECIEDKSDSASVIEGIRTLSSDKDSLISTNKVVFYNPAKMFEEDPIKASNGYIFKSNTYLVDPQTSFLMATKSIFTANLNQCKTDRMTPAEVITVTSETRDSTVLGELYNNTYVRFVPRQSNAYVDFQLPAVYSGEYKISLEMAPVNTHINYESAKGDPQIFRAEIVYDDDKKSEAKDITFAEDSIQKIVVWENYKFEKCYAGLPGNINTFARLRLTIPKARENKKNVTMNIVRVYIEPAIKETSSTPTTPEENN